MRWAPDCTDSRLDVVVCVHSEVSVKSVMVEVVNDDEKMPTTVVFFVELSRLHSAL